MFGISIELLSGRYIATAYNDRERVEWPPHPARLFSALIATWADGDDDGARRDAELAALRWLEQQEPPEILASSAEAAGVRTVNTVFVPVNDVELVSPPSREKLEEAHAALAAATDAKARARAERAVQKLERKLAAETARAIGVPAKVGKNDPADAERLVSGTRTRQPRTFPCATPECAAVAFVWPTANPEPSIREAISSLLARLVRLGHSSSLVRGSELTVEDLSALESRTTRYVPDEDGGDLAIRWVGPGQAEELMRSFDLHRETEPRVLPARFVRYGAGERSRSRPVPRSAFDDDFLVFARVGGPRLPITSVAGLSRQMRRALMSRADEPIHEVLSGHQHDGAPSEVPHLAIVPLPVVSGTHADGAILGVALVLPRDIEEDARRAVMRAIGRLEQDGRRRRGSETPLIELHLGEAGDLALQRVAWGEDRRSTLQSRTWSRPSRRWASATPLALDRNPGDLHHPDADKRRAAFEEATATVIEAVQRIGLPAPVEVDVVRSCVLPGTSKPRTHPRFPGDSRRPQRVLVHARLVFAEPVRGPVLIGAGRYHGLGLFLPVDDLRGDR